MFFRLKTVAGRRYLQIVNNKQQDGRVRQQVIASLGRVDGDLADSSVLLSLSASAERLLRRENAVSHSAERLANQTDATDFDLERYLPYRLERLSQVIGKGSQRYYRINKLATRDWRVLVLLFSFGEMTSTQIVQRGTVVKSGVSRSVATLTRKGLIERTRDATDTRRINLRLTYDGRSFVERLIPYNLARQQKILNVLNAEEVRQLDQILNKLQSHTTAMANTSDGLGEEPGTLEL